VLRARPKRTLFGMFFDVPNLTEVAARFAGLKPSKLATRQSASRSLLRADGRWAALRNSPGDGVARRVLARRGPRRGIRSPGRTGRRRSATNDGVTDRFDGKGLEDDGLDDPAPSRDAGNSDVVRMREERGGTSRGPRRRVTGEPTAGRGSPSRGGTRRGKCAGLRAVAQETRRTPWSAEGCNKPSSRRAEKAVEVVQNHEDGT